MYKLNEQYYFSKRSPSVLSTVVTTLIYYSFGTNVGLRYASALSLHPSTYMMPGMQMMPQQPQMMGMSQQMPGAVPSGITADMIVCCKMPLGTGYTICLSTNCAKYNNGVVVGKGRHTCPSKTPCADIYNKAYPPPPPPQPAAQPAVPPAAQPAEGGLGSINDDEGAASSGSSESESASSGSNMGSKNGGGAPMMGAGGQQFQPPTQQQFQQPTQQQFQPPPQNPTQGMPAALAAAFRPQVETNYGGGGGFGTSSVAVISAL